MVQKSVYITGGSEGIGFETAKIFIKEGFLVAITARREDKLKEAKQILGEHCRAYLNDVNDAQRTEETLKEFTSETGGKLDLLVNNAGYSIAGHFDSFSIEEYQNMVDTNLMGYIKTTLLALPYLKNANGAQIINVSSASAVYGNPELTVYAATKSAISSLTEGWNIGFKKYHIRVSDILPIYVQTSLLENAKDGHGADVLKNSIQPDEAATMVWKNYNGNNLHRIRGVITWWQNQFKTFIPHQIMAKMVLDYTKFK